MDVLRKGQWILRKGARAFDSTNRNIRGDRVLVQSELMKDIRRSYLLGKRSVYAGRPTETFYKGGVMAELAGLIVRIPIKLLLSLI